MNIDIAEWGMKKERGRDSVAVLVKF